MPYKLESTGESVEREAWRWEAHYNDGSVLLQFNDADQSFHQFAEIDQTKLDSFKMVHDNLPAHILVFPTGAKLVHKYVNAVLDYAGPEPQRIRLYAFGYQHEGANHFTAIMPDGTAIHTDDFDNIQVA